MSWFSNLLFGKDPAPSDAQRQLSAAINPAKKQADDLEGSYLEKANSFDPGAAFEQYAKGAMGNFQDTLGKGLRDLAGKSVGAGRLDTGFFDEDQGAVTRQIAGDFTRDLDSHAMQAASMQQQGIAELGQHSLAKSGEYLDLMSGQADRDTATQNAKRKQRSDFTSGLMSLGGTIAGAVL